MTWFGEPLPTNTTSTENPVTYLDFNWLEWVFTRKDSSGEKVEQSFDKFVLLNIAYKIDWWSDKYGCYLFSQESNDWNWPFNVKKTIDKATVIEWDYKDIKEQLHDMWPKVKLTLSLTIFGNSKVYNAKLKGTAYKAFSQFLNTIWDKKNTHYITMGEPREESNGGVKYKIPNFQLWDAMSEEDIEGAKFMYDSLYNNDTDG